MTLLAGPARVGLRCSEIHAVSKIGSVILVGLTIRGLAISFLTLASVTVPGSFLRFLCNIRIS
jgi:hypothetical protein